MDWAIIPMAFLAFLIVTLILWLCVNVLIYEFEKPDKPFFQWLGGK